MANKTVDDNAREFWSGPGYQGEYSCPHGVGHGNHIHGCDGCCHRLDFPLNPANIKATREREQLAAIWARNRPRGSYLKESSK